jgi:chaperonin cofactor prefoldin
LQMQRQLQASKLQQRRTELALSQLTELPLEVPVYKQVGKA